MPRPDLSNDAVTIETAPAALRVMGRPKLSWVVVAVGAVVGVFSLLLVVATAVRPMRRFQRGVMDLQDLIPLVIAALPLLAWIGLGAMVVLRWRRPGGIEIRDAVVTLHAPDSSRPLHVFDLSDLRGARVSGIGDGAASLLIERRRGPAVQLLPGHQAASLYTAVDAINAMVIDNVYHAFEVIPLAKPVMPPSSPPETVVGQSDL